jgi:hypothetical protein
MSRLRNRDELTAQLVARTTLHIDVWHRTIGA